VVSHQEPALGSHHRHLIDIFAFIPTFRKSFTKPEQETATTYALDALKFFLSILALEAFTPVTYLYPAAIVLLDSSFVAMLLIRRRQLKK
jgi:hypothetical protein